MGKLELGVSSFFSLLTWAFVFLVATLAIELFVMLRCRRMLKAAARPTGTATILMVLGLCVVAPIAGAWTGCAFAGQRSAADFVDEIDPTTAIEAMIDYGGAELRKALPPDDPAQLEAEKLRTLVRDRKARTGGGIDGLLEGIWWTAADAVLARALPEQLTTDKLVSFIEAEAKKKVREELGDYANGLRKSARTTVLIYLGLLALANGLVWFLIRRASAGPGPAVKRPVA